MNSTENKSITSNLFVVLADNEESALAVAPSPSPVNEVAAVKLDDDIVAMGDISQPEQGWEKPKSRKPRTKKASSVVKEEDKKEDKKEEDVPMEEVDIATLALETLATLAPEEVAPSSPAPVPQAVPGVRKGAWGLRPKVRTSDDDVSESSPATETPTKPDSEVVVPSAPIKPPLVGGWKAQEAIISKEQTAQLTLDNIEAEIEKIEKQAKLAHERAETARAEAEKAKARANALAKLAEVRKAREEAEKELREAMEMKREAERLVATKGSEVGIQVAAVAPVQTPTTPKVARQLTFSSEKKATPTTEQRFPNKETVLKAQDRLIIETLLPRDIPAAAAALERGETLRIVVPYGTEKTDDFSHTEDGVNYTLSKKRFFETNFENFSFVLVGHYNRILPAAWIKAYYRKLENTFTVEVLKRREIPDKTKKVAKKA